jgi:hypothetical protein
MEIGAFFILLIVLAVVLAGGLLLYGVAMKLRHEKLHPREDKLDGERTDQGQRPQHVRVANEQRARFITER